MLSMALEDAGFAVERAHDGKSGWERFSAFSPDLVVLDLLMPEIDGLELCRRIRERHVTPVVMLTSRARSWTRSSASRWAPTTMSPGRSRRAS